MRRDLPARLAYLALAAGTIALGLVVHFRGVALGPALRDVLGDALWAVMMVWFVSTLAPSARRTTRGAVSLTVCWAVECSQRYYTPSLDALRATTAGRLVLGAGFDPRDLASYAAGVAAAVLLDAAVRRRATSA